MRIASSISADAETLYSNVLTLTITPYSMDIQYPKLWVIGDYCGWNHGNSQFLYSANYDDNYAGMIYFDGKAANGWKLTPAGNWDAEWGMSGTPAAEAPTQTLVASGGANINVYSHNSYYLEFNAATGELKVSQAYDSWGIVGNHNGWGSGDTKMTLAMDENNEACLTATLDMPASNTWKIRPDEKWENDKGPSQLAFEGDVADNGDGNFIANEAGSYTIKWYFNKVEQKLVVTKN